MKLIEKTSVVKYKDGYYRVTALFSNTVNLGSVFGGKVYYKKIPLNEVVEAQDEWYSNWSKTEAYQCM